MTKTTKAKNMAKIIFLVKKKKKYFMIQIRSVIKWYIVVGYVFFIFIFIIVRV
jgi:hypothetical protein